MIHNPNTRKCFNDFYDKKENREDLIKYLDIDYSKSFHELIFDYFYFKNSLDINEQFVFEIGSNYSLWHINGHKVIKYNNEVIFERKEA